MKSTPQDPHLKIGLYVHAKNSRKNSYQMIKENERIMKKIGKQCKIQMGK